MRVPLSSCPERGKPPLPPPSQGGGGRAGELTDERFDLRRQGLTVGQQQVAQRAHGRCFRGQGDGDFGCAPAQGNKVVLRRGDGGTKLGLARGGAIGLKSELRLQQGFLGELEAFLQPVTGQLGALKIQVSLVAFQRRRLRSARMVSA